VAGLPTTDCQRPDFKSEVQRKPQVAGFAKDAAQRKDNPRLSATQEAVDLVW
jgi:hypothetical protein